MEKCVAEGETVDIYRAVLEDDNLRGILCLGTLGVALWRAMSSCECEWHDTPYREFVSTAQREGLHRTGISVQQCAFIPQSVPSIDRVMEHE